MHASRFKLPLFVLPIVLALYPVTSLRAADDGETARLVQKFETAISISSTWPKSLHQEQRQVVRKWTVDLGIAFYTDIKPEKVHLTTQGRMYDIMFEFLPVMSQYMGVPMRLLVRQERKKSQIDIWYVHPDRITKWLTESGFSQDIADRAVRNTACGIDVSELDQGIIPVTVSVRIDANPLVAPHCMFSGLLAALGLPGYMSEPQLSLTKVMGETVHALTNDVRILLRTLYDARITNGMPVTEAVAQARIIIPELLATVEKSDFRALFQITGHPDQTAY
tara:strand:+ start:2798 stop:3634 length:837 start_codon:yes stop_codon:yes gene_type:complete